MTDLTEHEKQNLALALFGYAMRSAPPLFPVVQSIAEKLEVTDLLTKYGLDWVAEAGKKKEPIEATPSRIVAERVIIVPRLGDPKYRFTVLGAKNIEGNPEYIVLCKASDLQMAELTKEWAEKQLEKGATMESLQDDHF